MAKVNISQAAHMAGVSRPTIHKKINAGELSTERANGKTLIDVSELERVFGTLVTPGILKPHRQDLHVETPQVVTILQLHIERLQHEIEVIRQERDSENARGGGGRGAPPPRGGGGLGITEKQPVPSPPATGQREKGGGGGGWVTQEVVGPPLSPPPRGGGAPPVRRGGLPPSPSPPLKGREMGGCGGGWGATEPPLGRWVPDN